MYYKHKNDDEHGYSDHDFLLDAISIDSFILQCDCNIKDINPDSIKKELDELIESRMRDLKEVFDLEKENILKELKYLRKDG